MPTTRTRKSRNQKARISEAAIEAFNNGDWSTLHRELKLAPWAWSPLDVNDGDQPYQGHGWEQAQELRKLLLEGETTE